MNLIHKNIEVKMGKGSYQDKYSLYSQYLRFIYDNEVYAVEVLKIKEIINNVQVTEVPNTNNYVEGVISVRGIILPVINFRRCLNFPDAGLEYRKNIIIIGYNGVFAGLPVDRVSEVIHIHEDKFSPVPQFVEKEKVEFFKGIIEHRDKFIMVLKVETLLNHLKNKI